MSIYIFCSFVTFFFFCLFYWLRLRSLYVFYIQILCQICGSVQCSYSVVSGSLGTAACQASLSITTPGVHPNSSPLSRWCHPTISSSVIPFASCPQSFPASGSSQMSQLFPFGHYVAKVLEFQLHHQSFQWREVKFHYENGPWHLWRGPPPEKLCFKLLLFKDIDKGETSRSFREGESRRHETAGRKHSTWPVHYCG